MSPIIPPDLVVQLRDDHARMIRVTKLMRVARGGAEDAQALQGLLLEVRRSIQGLSDVAAAFGLPLDELIQSHIDPRAASLSDMRPFFTD